MKRLILVGSPRTKGRSAALAETLFEANIADYPDDELFLVPISEVDVGPCIGCDGCKEKSEVIVKNESGQEESLWKHRCIFDDDMQTIYDLIDDTNEAIVVCPVYFSGTPAPFKCVLDRLQPYFWTSARREKKRPATLHVVGEGNDPHGFVALQSEVTSALAVAGFELRRVLDWVGKIDADGTITAEADERILGTKKVDAAATEEAPSPEVRRPRPQLNLSQKPKGGSQKKSMKGRADASRKPSTGKKPGDQSRKGKRRG